MKKDKPTLVIDRKNWAIKVMHRYTELTNKSISKQRWYIERELILCHTK